jgi:hypothetical protein
MDNIEILQYHDILGVIYNFADNYNCALVCKEFYNIIVKNSTICKTCNKFTKIFDKVQWITDETDKHTNGNIICHGYYKNIEYYSMIKRMLSLHPNFLQAIDRQCFAICLHTLKCNPLTIKYVKNQTEILCNIALDRNVDCIQHIVNPSEDMCIKVINKKPNNFKYIKNPTEKICIEAIKKEPTLLEFINNNNKTEQLCLYAVTKNGLCLEFIPESMQTENLCSIAFKNNIKSFKFISEKYQTHEMCITILNKDCELIHCIKNPKEEYYVELFKQEPEYFSTIFPKYNPYASFKVGNTFPSGHNNVALGYGAMSNCVNGQNNICIGSNSGNKIKDKNNNIIIGNNGLETDDGVIKIGTPDVQIKNYQAGIYGTNITAGLPVYISKSGQLGTRLW